MTRELREMMAAERRKGWSTKRAARAILRAAAAAGIELRVRAADTGSLYLTVQHDYVGGTVRVSDHAAPVGGGYNVARGERMGDADISVDPWSATVADAVRWVREVADAIREWEFAVECEELFERGQIPTA